MCLTKSLHFPLTLFYMQARTTGKGADEVISMLHDYTARHTYGETVMQVHADNCGGQNKNNCFLHYLCWRCLVGLNTSISYAFMMVGHTRFAPDWLAGLFKSTYRYLISLSWCPWKLEHCVYIYNEIFQLLLQWQLHGPTFSIRVEIVDTVNFSGLCSDQQLAFSPCWIEHLFLIIITPTSSNLVENFLFHY